VGVRREGALFFSFSFVSFSFFSPLFRDGLMTCPPLFPTCLGLSGGLGPLRHRLEAGCETWHNNIFGNLSFAGIVSLIFFIFIYHKIVRLCFRFFLWIEMSL
jgi:hypothetical protein